MGPFANLEKKKATLGRFVKAHYHVNFVVELDRSSSSTVRSIWHSIYSVVDSCGIFATVRDIARLCKMDRIDEALHAAELMQQRGAPVSSDIVYCILESCARRNDLATGKRVYSLMSRCELDSVAQLGDHLIRLFSSCGHLLEATRVFSKISNPTVYTWHAIISAHAGLGEKEIALELYHKMQHEGVKPNKFVFSCALKVCGNLKDIDQGRLIHDQIINSGIESDVFVGSTLVDMYAKCNSLEQARKVFDSLQDPNVVLWNTMMTGYAQHGHGLPVIQLFEKMQRVGLKPDRVTFLCILKSCCTLGISKEAKLVHQQIIESGLEADIVIGNTLIDTYSKCGDLNEACEVFETLPIQDVVSWSAMIAGYAQHGDGLAALELFEKMQQEGMRPERVTLLCILKACGIVGCGSLGKMIHEQLVRIGLVLDAVLGNTLIDMYAKCGSFEEACKTFDTLPSRTVVSWNAMLAGYVQHGLDLPALELADKMQQERIKPSNVTFSCIIKACGSLGAIGQGEIVYDQIISDGLDKDIVVGNTLVDMYAKCGNLEAAYKVFAELPNPDVVSWGAMIAGYSQHGHSLPALEAFQKMQQVGVNPDKVILLCILKACGGIGALNQGKLIHDRIVKLELKLDVVTGHALIDMYAKCGSLIEARKLFNKLPSRTVVSWNTLIAGYAQHGHCDLAFQCFEDMLLEGMKPVGRTYTSILTACSHAGYVKDGHRQFKCMRETHGVTPNVEHFNCMIDLLSRAGCLEDAEELLHCLPIPPDITGWMSLLASCKIFGNVSLGRECYNEVIQMDPDNSAGYVLMLNIYADARMWEDFHKLQEVRKCAAVWNKPGKAWLEVDEKMHEFSAGDTTHPLSDKIHSKFKQLVTLLKEEGYMPQLDLVLEQILKEGNRSEFGEHYEKLTTTSGCLDPFEGSTIRVTQNLLACLDSDCTSKSTLMIVKPDILTRDAYQFSHFHNQIRGFQNYL